MKYFIIYLLLFSINMYCNNTVQKPLNKKVVGDTIVVKIQSQVNKNNVKEVDLYFGYSLEEWKTVSTIAIPLIVLLISNLVTLHKIKLDTKESVRKELTISTIKIKREQLEKFYDPIVTYLSINEDIFKSFGPKSYPDDDIKRNVAAELWMQMRESIIVQNNLKIIDVVKTYSHLITSNDNLEIYLNFVKHASSYEHFIKFPNERHTQFPYPNNILSNAILKRKEIIDEVKLYEKNIINILDKLKK